MKLEEKLMKLRKEKGLSQEELGNEINVSRQSISKWELGQAKPDYEKIKVLCEYYDIPYEYLFDDEVDEVDEKNNNNKINISIKKLVIFTFICALFVLLFIYICFTLRKLLIINKIYNTSNTNKYDSYSFNIYQETIAVKGLSDINDISNGYVVYSGNYSYGNLNTKVFDTDKNLVDEYSEQIWEEKDERGNYDSYIKNTKCEANSDKEITTFEFTENSYSNRVFSPFIRSVEALNEKNNLILIINPFSKIKIIDDYFVLELNVGMYFKTLYYFEIKTGFLYKEENYLYENLVSKTIYSNYYTSGVNETIEKLTAQEKEHIINMYKNDMHLEEIVCKISNIENNNIFVDLSDTEKNIKLVGVDNVDDYKVGDMVCISYDGTIMTTSPAQIHIYSIERRVIY